MTTERPPTPAPSFPSPLPRRSRSGGSGGLRCKRTGGLAVSECSPVTHGDSCRALSLFLFSCRGEEEGVMRCCGKLLFESRQAKKRSWELLEIGLGKASLKSRRSRDDARLFSLALSLAVLFWSGALLSPPRRTSVFTHLGQSLIPSARHVFAPCRSSVSLFP